jgi:hypothetical protein
MAQRSARKTEKNKTLVLFTGYNEKKPEEVVVELGEYA